MGSFITEGAVVANVPTVDTTDSAMERVLVLLLPLFSLVLELLLSLVLAGIIYN